MAVILTTGSSADTSPQHDPYDRDISYIGGLSRYLFNGDRNDVTIATEVFFQEILARIGYQNVKLTTFDNTPDILLAMQEDRLDVVFSNPIDYVDIDHQVNPEFRYTVAYGTHQEQRIYLLKHSLLPITHIAQLKGKRLSIPKGYVLARTFLEIQLAKAGFRDPESFFSSIHETSTSNNAVLDLFFDKADLAVTTDVVYNVASELNPQLHRKINILTASSPYIPFIIGVNKQAPEDHLKTVDSIILNSRNNPRLKYILSLFGGTNVVKVTNNQVEALRHLKREHQQLLD